MKQTSLLLCALLLITAAQAQFKWNPIWPAGQKDMLEYTYSKIESGKDTVASFDTAYALIESTYLGQLGGDHFMSWKFTRYYMDTIHGDQTGTNVLMYGILSRTLASCPVQFTIDKYSFEVRIVNEEQIDSVSLQASSDLIAQIPRWQAQDDMIMMKSMVHSLWNLRKDKMIYDLIREYYRIYSLRDLVPNEKKNILTDKNNDGGKMMGGLADNAKGYSVLDDKDPALYKWHYESKIDMSEMMNSFATMMAAMLQSADSSAINDKGSKAKKKKEGKQQEKAHPAPKSEAISNMDITLSKTNMLVQSFSEYTFMGNMMGSNMNEVEQTSIRRKQ